jgi:ribosomal protein S6
MFTQEKQDLIDKKDWDGLLQTDILPDFEINDTGRYVFNFDFMYEFVLKRFHENAITANYKINIDSLFRNMFVRAKELKLNITANQWELIINEFIEIKKNNNNSFLINNGVFLDTGNKNSEFIKFLINYDNPELDKLYREYQSTIIIDSSNVNDLSANDIIELADKFNKIYKNESYYLVNFGFDDETIEKLINEIKTDDDLISFFEKINVPLHNAINLFSENRFISFIRKNLDIININNINQYIKIHSDMILPDDLVKTIVDTGKLYYFATVLTLEQIERYKDLLSLEAMLFNKRIPLDKVKEFKSVEFFDASKIRFFTEEEIIQNPEFFDPESVKKVGYLYVSESTFKLLNKTWSKKQKYENDLSDFTTLCNNLVRLKYFLFDDLRYIVKKTGASNDRVVKEIISRRIRPTSKNHEDFNFIKEFINSY